MVELNGKIECPNCFFDEIKAKKTKPKRLVFICRKCGFKSPYFEIFYCKNSTRCSQKKIVAKCVKCSSTANLFLVEIATRKENKLKVYCNECVSYVIRNNPNLVAEINAI